MVVNIYSPLAGDGIEAEELQLYQLINEYRIQNGLSSIALSKSLTLVANRHAWDLQENLGYLTHDWSDVTGPEAYWYAPQRLGTSYSDYAFENAYWNGAIATAHSALKGWKNSPSHNALLLNTGAWADWDWNAIGIGIHNNYAVMWVGQASDPAGSPLLPQPTASPAPPAPMDSFDEAYYLATNPDVARAVGVGMFPSGRSHFNRVGVYEGREPSLLFDQQDYLIHAADLQQAGFDLQQAYQHFQTHGIHEGRLASVQFDPAYYLSQHADLQAAGFDYEAAYQHFYRHGVDEGRRSSAEFFVFDYLNHNPDLQAAGFTLRQAFDHYRHWGIAEGRSGHGAQPA